MLELHCELGITSLNSTIADKTTRYTLANGLCGNLAQAILEHDPSREVNFVAYDCLNENDLLEVSKTSEDFHSKTTHVVIKSTDDRFLDSYGSNTREEIEEFYSGKLIKGNHSMLREFYVTEAFEADKDCYRILAKSVLDSEKSGISYSHHDL